MYYIYIHVLLDPTRIAAHNGPHMLWCRRFNYLGVLLMFVACLAVILLRLRITLIGSAISLLALHYTFTQVIVPMLKHPWGIADKVSALTGYTFCLQQTQSLPIHINFRNTPESGLVTWINCLWCNTTHFV